MIERPGKIVAIGLNYMDHAKESGTEPPKRPLIFAKFTTSVINHEEQIRIPRKLTERVDWEVELAVIIGREATRVSEKDALSHVRGYTVANDVSARDLQFADGQWVRAKSLDTFCPLGPKVVELDDLILTGTPWGVGEFMDPKRSLKDGDVVECEIEGIGVLRNPVVDV
jgi:5-carboxymethyl-2-hydroxymuconate isomerase